MNIKFLLLLSLDAWTGGSLYQRQMVDHLQRKGHRVETAFVDELVSPASLVAPGPDLLLWDGMSIIGWFSRWQRLPRQVPQALIVHAPFSRQHLEDEAWLPYPPEQLFEVERRLFVRMDGLIVPSARIKHRLVERYGTPAQIISVHPPTANLPVGPAVLRRPSSKEWLFLSIGAISPRKNQLALVQALAMLGKDRPWKLRLVGQTAANPAYTEEVESYIRAHRLQDRIALGPASTPELMDLISSAHLHLFASHDEGFGMAIYETIHAGLPTAYIEENCGLGLQFQSIIPAPARNDAAGWLEVIQTFLERPSDYEVRAAAYRRQPPAWETVVNSIEERLQALVQNSV